MFRSCFFISCIIVLAIACSTKADEKASATGADLAKIHCVACHTLPTPDLLDVVSWEKYMLPRMGNMLGFYSSSQERVDILRSIPPSHHYLYPEKPRLSKEEWEAITAFYLDNAPETLPRPEKDPIQVGGLKQFKVVKPRLQLSPPSSTMALFSPDRNIFIGDAHTQSLIQVDEQLGLGNLAKVREGAVHLHFTPEAYWITVMGSFSPTDNNDGMIVRLPLNRGQNVSVPVKDLRRPVHSTYADFNGDGLTDIAVCEFGKWAGLFSLHIQKQDGTYDRSVLLDQTGPIRSYARDMDNDGDLDLVSLFGQGNEGIYLHTNDGSGKFSTKPLIRFSASNGSSFFDLTDFDGDGDEDIIYAAGDNADFPPVLKPYHGVYVYENTGNLLFEEAFFYPLNGAYGAIAEDFDLDGDIDICAISFFPDYREHPEEGFVYLENTGEGYEASTFEEINLGRWIVMDHSDHDGDGDEDVILGSLAFEVIGNDTLIDHWMKQGLPFILLENTAR
jgi:hypothetical protein